MGTHPIFESDFDCLTDQKFQISKWPNHKWNLFFKICKKNLKVKSKRATKLEMKKTESAKELVNSRLSSLKLKWSNQNLIFSAMMLLFINYWDQFWLNKTRKRLLPLSRVDLNIWNRS